jgi:hypothetical protein
MPECHDSLWVCKSNVSNCVQAYNKFNNGEALAIDIPTPRLLHLVKDKAEVNKFFKDCKSLLSDRDKLTEWDTYVVKTNLRVFAKHGLQINT